jgi:DNA-binding response OmpR family regulator
MKRLDTVFDTLKKAKGQVVAPAVIERALYGDQLRSGACVKVAISHLRARERGRHVIQSIRGEGYRMLRDKA